MKVAVESLSSGLSPTTRMIFLFQFCRDLGHGCRLELGPLRDRGEDFLELAEEPILVCSCGCIGVLPSHERRAMDGEANARKPHFPEKVQKRQHVMTEGLLEVEPDLADEAQGF